MNFKKHMKELPYAPSKEALEAATKAQEALDKDPALAKIIEQQNIRYQRLHRRFIPFAVACICILAIGISLLFPQVQTLASRLWASLTQQSAQESAPQTAHYLIDMPNITLTNQYVEVDHIICLYQSDNGYPLVYIEDYSPDGQSSLLTTESNGIIIDGVYSGIPMKGYIEPDSIYVQFDSNAEGRAFQGSLSIDYSLSKEDVEEILNHLIETPENTG